MTNNEDKISISTLIFIMAATALVIIVGYVVFFAPISVGSSLFVVDYSNKVVEKEINYDHTKIIETELIELHGYYSNWNGDINNTEGIKLDYVRMDIFECYTEKHSICTKIKPNDIIKINYRYEPILDINMSLEIVGSMDSESIYPYFDDIQKR